MIQALLKFERMLVAIEEGLVFSFLVLIVISSSAQMASRFLFDFPLGWTEELGRAAQMWLIFIGAAVAAYKAEHFVVDFLMARISFHGKHWITRAVDVLVVGFFCVLTAITAHSTIVGADQQMSILTISVAWAYAALPVGCILMAFHFAMAWVRPLNTNAALGGGVE